MAMDACTGCQACVEVCPAVAASGDGTLSALYRLNWQRANCRAGSGWLGCLLGGRRSLSEEDWRAFADTVYRCTLCGNCQQVCPSGIGLKELWLILRQEMTQKGTYPKKVDLIGENLAESRNVFAEDQEDRCEWVEDCDEVPDDEFVRDRAEVVYFTGCVASFFPLAQQIPVALAEVLEAGEVDFTLLGEEEWCCGFPLLGAGRIKEVRELVEHNVEAVREKGAKEVVFACPSCYMMWREHYPHEFKLTHTTQFLADLLARGRVPLRKLDMRVTYHDPCDLGRGAGVYEPPRQTIRSLPGVDLVEMAQNREACQCCGGGGNLEMIDQGLSGAIAERKIKQALATGAEAVISSCQQCVRTMATYTRRNKLPLMVMDIAQLVRKAADI